MIFDVQPAEVLDEPGDRYVAEAVAPIHQMPLV